MWRDVLGIGTSIATTEEAAGWRRLAKRTVETHVARHGWVCPGWHRELHAVRPGEFAADHPDPLVLGGEPLPAHPGVLCSSCNARNGLSLRRC